jgi:xanthine/CO dehydrogenase XdhC/CoxF family maturation factor
MPTIASFDYAALSCLVVATRGHKLDADCVTAAVGTRVPYIGLLGSRRKTILIADMLREEGVDESRSAAIHAPVGLDLGGRTPAEIALSVLAEITQRRCQGTASPAGPATDRAPSAAQHRGRRRPDGLVPPQVMVCSPGAHQGPHRRRHPARGLHAR